MIRRFAVLVALSLGAGLYALPADAQTPSPRDTTVVTPAQSRPDSGAVRGVTTEPPFVTSLAIVPDSSRTPAGALRRALLLPGLGQVYNGQPLKTPVVVAALGGAIAYFVVQQRRTTLYRRAALYAGCVDVPERPVCDETDLDALLPAYLETEGERVGAASLRTTRDNARGSRDLAAVGVAAVYGLQALDAYVGAHLLSFDVGEDLSLRAIPAPGVARLALRVRL